MDVTHLALFETAIGACGIAWSATAIRGVQLPENDPEQTAARLASRQSHAIRSKPFGPGEQAIDAIVALLGGARLSLDEIVIDESDLGPFDGAVYRAARRVGPGATSTYGRIAEAIGRPGEARAVGQALGRNPFPIIVPCHRILGAGGKVGGFSGAGGVDTKLRMLTIEGAGTGEAPSLFDSGGWPLEARPRRG